jgi:hypothetical protein
MGGHVSVVIRRSSGAIQKMLLWTNIVPSFFVNPKMIQEDSDLIGRLIATRDLNNDAIRLSEDFTDKRYLGFVGDYCSRGSVLAPVDYGLIVFDFKENTVHSMQSYCSLDHACAMGCRKSVAQHKAKLNDDLSISNAINGFMSSGILNHISFYDMENVNPDVSSDIDKKINGLGLDFHDVIHLISTDKSERKQLLMTRLGLPPTGLIYAGFGISHPMNVIYYENESKDLLLLKHNLISDGFSISADEDKIWSDFYNEYKELEDSQE